MHTPGPIESAAIDTGRPFTRALPLLLLLVAGSVLAAPARAQDEPTVDLHTADASLAEKEAATRTFLDPQAPKEARLAAAANLGYPEDETFAAMLRIGADPAVDEDIRRQALLLHRFDEDYLDVVLTILEEPENTGPELVADLVENLSRRTTFRLPAPLEQRIRAVLRDLLDSPHERVRLAAYRSLIGGHDTVGVNRLVDALDAGEAEVPIPLAEAIALLDLNGSIYHIRTLQPYLDHPDPAVQAQAARALAVDPSSQPRIVDLANSRATPEEVRLHALRALAREDEGFAAYAIDLVADREESPAIRYQAMKTLTGRMNYRQVDEGEQIRFAQTVEALAAEPAFETKEGEALQREAKELLGYLREAFPAVRRHYDRP